MRPGDSSAELPKIVTTELALAKRAARLSVIFDQASLVVLGRFGLTKGEYDTLATLRAAGAPYRLRPTDLSRRLLVTSGGMSNLLRGLVAAGMVSREADDRDARSTWVKLTEQGVTTAGDVVEAATSAQQVRLRAVPEDISRAAADAIRAVLVALGDHA